LRKFFKEYGNIKSIKIVCNKEGKSRGYAFIEYEHKSDFKRAYKESDGRKIDGRKVMVDCERGRVVENWLPKRLGGGKGESRKTIEDKYDLLYE
jgi:U1 small nuclear ribonucleoprotein